MIFVQLQQVGEVANFTYLCKGVEAHLTIGKEYPDRLLTLKQGESVWLCLRDDEVFVRKGDQPIGSFQGVRFITDGEEPYFSILTGGKTFTYADNLWVKAGRTGLLLTNEVFIENYLAGVMAGEIGSKISPDFLKVQAVCSRTYVYRGLGKHKNEGFDMCDKVHCQAYKGITYHQKKYLKACLETQNEVIMTSDGKLIDAVFYANCGGATANSEDVWPNAIPYLRSVPDANFCANTINTNWRKMLQKQEFLKKIGQYYKTNASSYKLYRDETGRIKYLLVNNQQDLKITGEQLRRLFGLKSARFTITEQGNYLYFIGKGFGHGVGMCQDGAFARSEAGWNYKKIIQHYYTNVEVKPIELFEALCWKY